MTEPLKVDAELLEAAGERLLSAARGLPGELEAFTVPAGSDALSQALSTEIPKAETPIIEGLPPMKQNAISTAESVIEAARRYASTDSQLKSRIDEAVRLSGSGPGGSGGAPAGGGLPTSAAPVGAASSVPASTAGGGAGGPLGSMMGMPMQMAQQAAQIPSQAAGMAASLPQSAMQGAQQIGEQVTEMVSQFGEKDGQETESEPAERGGRHRAEEPEGATSGEPGAERAPATPSRSAQADSTINL